MDNESISKQITTAQRKMCRKLDLESDGTTHLDRPYIVAIKNSGAVDLQDNPPLSFIPANVYSDTLSKYIGEIGAQERVRYIVVSDEKWSDLSDKPISHYVKLGPIDALFLTPAHTRELSFLFGTEEVVSHETWQAIRGAKEYLENVADDRCESPVSDERRDNVISVLSEFLC